YGRAVVVLLGGNLVVEAGGALSGKGWRRGQQIVRKRDERGGFGIGEDAGPVAQLGGVLEIADAAERSARRLALEPPDDVADFVLLRTDDDSAGSEGNDRAGFPLSRRIAVLAEAAALLPIQLDALDPGHRPERAGESQDRPHEHVRGVAIAREDHAENAGLLVRILR